MGPSLQDFQELPQKLGAENYSTLLMRNVCENVFRDRLLCFADFAVETLLAVLFLLPLANCFPKVCLPTFFAAVLKFFLPLRTSAISGTAKSNKSASTRFAAGTIYLRKNGFAVHPTTCANATTNHRPRYRAKPLWNGISTCLEATIL